MTKQTAFLAFWRRLDFVRAARGEPPATGGEARAAFVAAQREAGDWASEATAKQRGKS